MKILSPFPKPQSKFNLQINQSKKKDKIISKIKRKHPNSRKLFSFVSDRRWRVQVRC